MPIKKHFSKSDIKKKIIKRIIKEEKLSNEEQFFLIINSNRAKGN